MLITISLHSVPDFIQWILLLYFLFSALYFLVFAIAGNFSYRKHFPKASKLNKIAVLIPAYREDAVILHTVRHALKLNYPGDLYDVIIAADHLQPETLQQLSETQAIVVELNLNQSSKAKALTETMQHLKGNHYDIAIVLDADNQTEPDFLLKINDAFQSGCRVIQAHRVAKNMNTNFAVLDAISEEVNNHLFRKAHRILGLPAILIGSGMAFPWKLFQQLISTAKTSFEDKEIEFMLLENGYDIDYLEDAYVYDEKVQNHQAFGRQRTRWIYSQIYFFRLYFMKSFPAFFKKNKRGLAFRSFSTALPPRVILLAVPFLMFILNLFFPTSLWLSLWGTTFLASLLTILLSTPKKFYNIQTIKALISLPLAFILMLKAIIFSGKAKKGFLHTGHTGAGMD